MKLRLAHLYPKLMNIYGDRGNIMCFRRRTEGRGIDLEVDELTLGDRFDPAAYDLVFIGGAQDVEQRRVADDLLDVKAEALREYAENDGVMLAVCGGYQLMGAYYKGADGGELAGAHVLDIWTEHPGEGAQRCIGNIAIEREDDTIVGFENHGGRTYLGQKARPLGRVVSGYGNNGIDGTEGAVYGNVFGTYMHGSLLPKNPRFADRLISLALAKREGDVQLSPLDDMVETQAHAQALRHATRRKRVRLGG
ncbi:MAG TPA: glutamine amidotransferase [Dehalococcoidia bacterium]|nr:glutamine amidotransferase [Dehalococcoidia bacterium]